MKAYKIQVDPYDVEISVLDEKGKEIKQTKTMYPKYELPRHVLCNSNIGVQDGKPPKGYDLMEIGPIAQKIEHERDIFITVSEDELKILKQRIEFCSPYFGYNYFEMFRRVIDAQAVDMIESKGK